MTYFLAKYSLYDISRENITELNINMQQAHPLKWKQNGLMLLAFFFLSDEHIVSSTIFKFKIHWCL